MTQKHGTGDSIAGSAAPNDAYSKTRDHQNTTLNDPVPTQPQHSRMKEDQVVSSEEATKRELLHSSALTRWHNAVSLICQQLGDTECLDNQITSSISGGRTQSHLKQSNYVPSFSQSRIGYDLSDENHIAIDNVVEKPIQNGRRELSVSRRSISGLPISAEVVDIVE